MEYMLTFHIFNVYVDKTQPRQFKFNIKTIVILSPSHIVSIVAIIFDDIFLSLIWSFRVLGHNMFSCLSWFVNDDNL